MDTTYRVTEITTDDDERVRFLRYEINHKGNAFNPTSTTDERRNELTNELDLRCDGSGRWNATMHIVGNAGASCPEDALGYLTRRLARMSLALAELQHTIDAGLKNPSTDDPFRYTRDGLIKRLQGKEKCMFADLLDISKP